MKTIFICISILTVSLVSAQSFTWPDSTIVAKEHVRTINVYAEGYGWKHELYATVTFDSLGSPVSISYTRSDTHADYTYDSLHRVASITWDNRRISDKKMHTFTYWPNNKVKNQSEYMVLERNILTSSVDRDSLGNMIRELRYDQEEPYALFFCKRYGPYQSGHFQWEVDSSLQERQSFSNGQLVEDIIYGKQVEEWEIFYDDRGRPDSLAKNAGRKDEELYSISYLSNTWGYVAKKNGKQLDGAPLDAFNDRWGYLFREEHTDSGITLSTVDHHPETDARGLIIKDHITREPAWDLPQISDFYYEYSK